MKRPLTLIVLLLSLLSFDISAQHSVAREWNEMQLICIRKDLARPAVQARNLFHMSMAMYDAWAAYDTVAKTYLLGDSVGAYYAPFTGVPAPADVHAAREEAISYAAYRMLKWRYRNAPGAGTSLPKVDSLFLALGYDSSYHSVAYANGNPADLGNYIAQQVIAYGMTDGANEVGNYLNQYYTPVNPSLLPALPGNPDMIDPDRWQPLTLNFIIDQNGFPIPTNTQAHLTAEWGNVVPFALTDADKTVFTRDSNNYNVYHDPGPPPYIDTVNGLGLEDEYKWTHVLVSTWSSHLDPSDSVMMDISPNSIGDAHDYPTSYADHPNFYDLLNGGDNSRGYTVNPKTGQPYAQQIVPRGDYTRVLAEFWADGPSSETPPGHWFSILNYVNDHPDFEKRWGGKGPIVDELEWNVKSYFTLGGATHDAAITAWALKGWYDSARPISAIRYMADQGQSSDTSLANYSPKGIPLIPGFVEVVDSNDVLSGGVYQHVGKIKVKAWKGPNYIVSPDTTVAGVDWILAEEWWPYQRPTFVTPPFAGYVSGHSTYSRTAAEAMTLITGDEYFPGGMGEFLAPMNQYLVFEDGPSVDVTLQWAKYKDASDQCSLSRIWGGIHPPADDIPGRLLGQVMGPAAFNHAEEYFDSEKPTVTVIPQAALINDAMTWSMPFTITLTYSEEMDTTVDPVVTFPVEDPTATLSFDAGASGWTNWNTYVATYTAWDADETVPDVDVRVSGAQDVVGNVQEQTDAVDNFSIDTENPQPLIVLASSEVISDTDVGTASFVITVTYREEMNTAGAIGILFPMEDPAHTLTFNISGSLWIGDFIYAAKYDIADSNITIADIDVRVVGGMDANGNPAAQFDAADNFSIDMENPMVVSVTPSVNVITDAHVGSAAFTLTVTFDEAMNTTVKFPVDFPVEDASNTLTYNANASEWSNATTYLAKYDVTNAGEAIPNVDVEVAAGCADAAGNLLLSAFDEADKFSIDMTTGIAGVDERTIRVYPNPVRNHAMLNVEFTRAELGASLQLLNAQGRSVLSSTVQNESTKLALTSLPAGLYLLRVSAIDKEQAIHVVILEN